MAYYTTAFREMATIRPRDQSFAVGVLAEEMNTSAQVGIAYPYSHVGGWRQGMDPLSEDFDPPEVVWRLEVDHAWVDGRRVPLERKGPLEGRYVLRAGRFFELGEAAE